MALQPDRVLQYSMQASALAWSGAVEEPLVLTFDLQLTLKPW